MYILVLGETDLRGKLLFGRAMGVATPLLNQSYRRTGRRRPNRGTGEAYSARRVSRASRPGSQTVVANWLAVVETVAVAKAEGGSVQTKHPQPSFVPECIRFGLPDRARIARERTSHIVRW